MTCLILFSFLRAASQAERIFDSLTAHFAVRDSQFSSSQLYLHVDKTIYTASENIWFSAYLLKTSGTLTDHHTLYVLLSHRITHEVVASSQFVMENGLAAGNLFVADSFPAGDYNLIAYTNAMSKEHLPGYFQQQISIRYGGGNPFRIDLARENSVTDSIRFLARVTNKAMLNATGATFDYTVYSGNRKLSKGRSIVSPFGEVPISIPNDPSCAKLELSATVKKEKTSFSTRVPLSFLSREIVFRWFPEGGHWIDGLPCRTAFEVTDRSGKPAVLRGKLLEDGKPVLSFQSSPTGLGVVEIKPLSGKKYSILPDDTTYKVIASPFPEVSQTGVAMRVTKAVVNDTLQVRVQSRSAAGKLYMLIHNYSRVYDLWQLNMFNPSATIKIPATMLDHGLATLTLFDSTMRPLAERTVFSGYDSLPVISIAADSSTYHKRSKVALSIRVNDIAGKPLNASISMATVLARTIDTTRFQDLAPYQLFSDYIAMGIIPRIGMYGVGNKDDLEMMLLVRCWTNYRDPSPDTVANRLAFGKQLEIAGIVKAERKKARNKPVSLTVLAGGGMKMVMSDSLGRFQLPLDATVVNPDEKIALIINEKNREDFTLEMDHDVDSLNAELARLDYPEALGIKAVMPWDEESLNQVKTLSAVIVKSKVENTEWGTAGDYVSTTCRDYACMNNILNCRNHPFGTPAVEGGMYYVGGRLVKYHCPGNNAGNEAKELLIRLKGRYYSREFYVADYARFNPPDPEKGSTIFWSQQTPVIDGQANISFYTNDLSGLLSVIIEGVSDLGPVSAHALLKVAE